MNNEELTKHIKRAFEYKAAGNFKQAIENLYKALEIDPESAEVLAEIAGLYNELSNPEKAIRYYEQALLYDSENASIKFKLAKTYKQVHLISKALPLLRSISEKDLNPAYIAEVLNVLYLESDFETVVNFYSKEIVHTSKNPKIHYYAGASYLALGDSITARKLYQKSLIYDNTDYDIAYSCATLLYEEGLYKESAKVLLSCPTAKMNHKTFYLLGEICIAQDNVNEAINNYSKACKLNPRNPLYYYSLATAYSINGFMKEAEENYHNAVKLSPNNLFYAYTLALVYYETKQISKAKEKIKSILNINSENINALLLKARILTDENNVVDAEQILKQVLKKEPKNEMAQYIRAQIFKKLGWWEKAIEAMSIAISQSPTSMEYISELAIFYFENKQFSESEKTCKKLVEINDKYIFAYTKLAEIYVEQRRFSEALENIDKTLELDMNVPSSYMMKAKIYRENKLFDQAIEFAKQAISLSPYTMSYYDFVAETYFENNQIRDALKYYKEAASVDVSSAKLRYMIAKCKHKIGDTKEAVADYSVAMRLCPQDINIAIDYCNCLCDLEEYKTAMNILKQALKYAKNDEEQDRIYVKADYVNEQIAKRMNSFQRFIGKFKK